MKEKEKKNTKYLNEGDKIRIKVLGEDIAFEGKLKKINKYHSTIVLDTDNGEMLISSNFITWAKKI